MRKLLILIIVLGIAGYAGYNYIQQDPEVKAKVDEKKFQAEAAYAVSKVIKAQNPKEVKAVLAENQALIDEMKNKGYFTEEELLSFITLLDQMEARGETFNRVKILEHYAKDKLVPEKYQQVEEILRKPDFGTADLYKIFTIIQGP